MVDAALMKNTKLLAALYDFDYRIDVHFLEGVYLQNLHLIRGYKTL